MFNDIIEITIVFTLLAGTVLILFLTADKKNINPRDLYLKKQN
tara:strand:+ start:333 stop:461 length:129 start_codon:yes stop_codon:yes gene_type:complete